ncbi:hypothetical protein J6590_033970 [Homalodisca vitripennis]|nr:hypothetical protein J6590_033970 [Homalodisca vitripennis]
MAQRQDRTGDQARYTNHRVTPAGKRIGILNLEMEEREGARGVGLGCLVKQTPSLNRFTVVPKKVASIKPCIANSDCFPLY